MDYQLSDPRSQFLSYLGRTRNLVLHRSQNLEIDEMEPREAHDVRACGKQKGIYATADGIGMIYLAVIDRKEFPEPTLFNSCVHIRTSANETLGPLYFFSLTRSALHQESWSDGAVYRLPREKLEQEPPQQMFGVHMSFSHWTSSRPARSVARLHVRPHAFPVLAQIQGHDNRKLRQPTVTEPDGLPWPQALET